MLNDPYTEIRIEDDFNFELIGDESKVPLSFKPVVAYIVRFTLANEHEFTINNIYKNEGFEELCEDIYPLHRFDHAFSRLRFTLDSVNSSLIKNIGKLGSRKLYERNKDYTITDPNNIILDFKINNIDI